MSVKEPLNRQQAHMFSLLRSQTLIETLGSEIPFLLGDPFLQPEMRSDDEFCHGIPFAFPFGVSSRLGLWAPIPAT
jgi:hypothetical protein